MHKILKAIGKHDLVIPKSRIMGVTYFVLATLFHQWCFYPMRSFLLASAKEDRVDSKDDPSCLFWKLDHMLKCLPWWLAPASDRAELKLANLEQESVFNGESTNKNVDRGGRRTAVLADEAAAMRDSSKIAASIQHVTNSCLWVSTPQGGFGAFYDMCEKYSRECPDWVMRLHWTMHPIYSRGLYYDGDGQPRSPWYDQQCLRAPGPRWIAQELDIGFNAAGGQYFEQALIDRLIRTTVRDPQHIGELEFGYQTIEPNWQRLPQGRLQVWCPLSMDGKPPRGQYGVGCDIATGKGGEMSSQSAASVVDLSSGEKVAEFKHNRITPTNFARYAVAICKWFHNAKLIWGSQGPGSDFGKTVEDDCRYFHVWTRDEDSQSDSKRGRKTGFVEMGDNKMLLFGSYADALNEGRFVNRSKEAVLECRQFIFANGTIEHCKAIQSDQDPENAGKLHGDIVVGDALANHLLPKHSKEPESLLDPLPPIGSPAWKLQEYLRENREKEFY